MFIFADVEFKYNGAVTILYNVSVYGKSGDFIIFFQKSPDLGDPAQYTVLYDVSKSFLR